jgi:hypothetical protein
MSWFKIQSIFSVIVVGLLIATVTGVMARDRLEVSNRTEFDPAGAKWPWFNQTTREPASPGLPSPLPGRRSDQVAFNPEGVKWPWFNNTGSSGSTDFGTTPLPPSDVVAFDPQRSRWPSQRLEHDQGVVLAKESARVRDVPRLRTPSRLNRR